MSKDKVTIEVDEHENLIERIFGKYGIAHVGVAHVEYAPDGTMKHECAVHVKYNDGRIICITDKVEETDEVTCPSLPRSKALCHYLDTDPLTHNFKWGCDEKRDTEHPFCKHHRDFYKDLHEAEENDGEKDDRDS